MRNYCSYLTDGLLETLQVVATAVVGLFANLIFFTTLLWTVARRWAGRTPSAAGTAGARGVHAGPGGGGRRGCRVLRPGGPDRSGGRALAAGGIALAGVALGMFVRMFQPGWPLRHSLRRLAVVLVVAGAALGLVTVVLPELIVFTAQRPGRPAADRAGQRGDRRRLVERQGRRQPGLHRHGGRRGHGRRPGGAGAAVALGGVGRGAGGVRGDPLDRPPVAACAGWPTWCSAAWSGQAPAAAALFILNGGAQAARPSSAELVVWAVMALLTLAMLLFADVTSWSLHPFYKWRLSLSFAAVRWPTARRR